MAEGTFRDLVKKDPTYQEKIGRIDSCGTGRAASWMLADIS
jgi:hypothetical protein